MPPHSLTATLRRLTSLALLAAFLTQAPSASAQINRLGVLGDSLSDEYAEQSYSYAKNWTMQLVLYRGVNLGPTAAAAGQAGGTWGEPRRTRYQTNWARYGADSSTLLSQGQHTGVAAQVSTAGVTQAVLAIGANDFAPALGGAYFNIYNALWSNSQIDSYVAGRIANIQTVVNTLRSTGCGLVLASFPDYGVAPATWMSIFFSNATKRERVSAVIRRVNTGVRGIAQTERCLYADLNGLGIAIFGTNGAPRQFLKMGNQSIQLWVADTASNSNPLAGTVDDGVHPHTTLQGLFSNVMMTALNLGFGASLVPFTETEMLQHAGLAYGGSDTLEAQIGRTEDFVTNFRCQADYDKDGFLTGDDFDRYISDFEAGKKSADFNGDGFVTGEDFDDFVNDFQMGC